MKIRIHFVEN